MEYNKFEQIVNCLEKQYGVECKVCSYIQPELFDNVWKAVSILLNTCYPKSALDYVFDSYIFEDNKLPVTINNKEYPVTNTKELWIVMELLKQEVNDENVTKVDESIEILKEHMGMKDNE